MEGRPIEDVKMRYSVFAEERTADASVESTKQKEVSILDFERVWYALPHVACIRLVLSTTRREELYSQSELNTPVPRRDWSCMMNAGPTIP